MLYREHFGGCFTLNVIEEEVLAREFRWKAKKYKPLDPDRVEISDNEKAPTSEDDWSNQLDEVNR